MIQNQKFERKKQSYTDPRCVNFDTECRILGDQKERFDEIHNKNNQQINKVCRVCLECQTISTSINEGKDGGHLFQTNPIVNLPCACKNQLGMIHENCMKFWIKVWLESKIASLLNGSLQANDRQRQRRIDSLENEQRYLGNPQNNSSSRSKIKTLNPRKLKQKTFYPFPCQICLHPIYFDLFFHYRLKSYPELRTKDLILFILPFFFTLAFLGICINWIVQTGVNLYLILFYSLVWLPLFMITVAIGVWTFSKKEFWVKGIYSRQEIRRRNFIEQEQKNKIDQKDSVKSLEKQEYSNIKKKLEQIRGKYFNKMKKQIHNTKTAQINQERNKNEDQFDNVLKKEKYAGQSNGISEDAKKKQENDEEIQICIQQESPGNSAFNLNQ